MARQIAFVICLSGVLSPIGATTLNAQRDRFTTAESELAAGSQASLESMTRGIEDYPLTPYLERAIFERDLKRIDEDIASALLVRQGDLPGTRTLVNLWVEELARRGHWQRLARDYAKPTLGLSVGARCRVAQAQLAQGQSSQAWQQVNSIWPASRSLPSACDAVLEAWHNAGQASTERIWQRLVKAVPAKSTSLVRYLQRLLPPSDSKTLDRWLAARAADSDLSAWARTLDLNSALAREMLLDALTYRARRNPRQAMAQWRQLQSHAALSGDFTITVESAIGTHLARAGERSAFALLTKGHTDDALQARAELAIELRDWAQLLASITAMDGDTAAHGRWRYWRSRARELLNGGEADAQFHQLAQERGYYAFLAADRLGHDYNMAPRPITAGQRARTLLENNLATERVREFVALGRAEEARREWFTLLARVEQPVQAALARIAHDNGWDALAIFAAGQAQQWHDLSLRFPLAHYDLVQAAASSTGLSQERVFAIIRQESAFMVDARSSAGALGPMQLMPATARLVARWLDRTGPAQSELMQPRLNIELGSHYLARLEQRYSAHPVLAAAAYNAGPGNVSRWLPRQGQLSSELWIEGIPFRETRDYVQRVLAYQAIYRFRLGLPQVRISSWMPNVPSG